MNWSSAGRGDPVTKSNEASAVGSSETFEEFYEREFAAVVGLAYALSGNRSGAEDLAQEAFLLAHRDWDRVGTYGCVGWSRTLPSRSSGVERLRRRRLPGWPLATRQRCPSCRQMTRSSGG